jgi:hypothetical protein
VLTQDTHEKGPPFFTLLIRPIAVIGTEHRRKLGHQLGVNYYLLISHQNGHFLSLHGAQQNWLHITSPCCALRSMADYTLSACLCGIYIIEPCSCRMHPHYITQMFVNMIVLTVTCVRVLQKSCSGRLSALIHTKLESPFSCWYNH